MVYLQWLLVPLPLFLMDLVCFLAMVVILDSVVVFLVVTTLVMAGINLVVGVARMAMVEVHWVTASKDVGQVTHSADAVVTISMKEYQRLPLLHFLIQVPLFLGKSTGSFVGYITSSLSFNPWFIDSSASTGTSIVLSNRQSIGKPSHVTLADGCTIDITGVGSIPVTSSSYFILCITCSSFFI